MKITTSSKLPASCDALFLFANEKKFLSKSYAKLLTPAQKKSIEELYSAKDFQGEMGEIMQIFPSFAKNKKTFLVGLGKLEQVVDIRKAASLALRRAKKIKAKNVAFLLPAKVDLARVTSGAILGDYTFKIGEDKEKFSPTKLTLISSDQYHETEIAVEQAIAEATNYTRELINLPGGHMHPELLAAEARKLGKKKNISVKVLGEKAMHKLNMGALLSVGQGSSHESQLIILEYKGTTKKDAPTAFIGKGVCFDSGGYNLKPTGHIEDMKSDMSGAATVLGIFHFLAELQPKQNFIGVIGAVENMLSSDAVKPGDIVTAMNGKTIEITNTDAEGRMVLTDCLHYTVTKYKPSQMIDIATLTGAAIAALGYEITAFMGNDKKLLASLTSSAQNADEDLWELPITPFFRTKIKNDISDLQNWTAGISAGSSMGGAFLESFVSETPWAHLDIAGTAFHQKAGDELSPKGATGVMMRTLAHWILDPRQ